MIELFAKLINTYDRVDIKKLIQRAIQEDEFVRENTSLQYIEREEVSGSENFFFIDDQQASIKRDVYLSFFVYKMLLTMKRYQKKHGESHQLIAIDDINQVNSILENHVYRIISKIQDAEYKITEKSPRTFIYKPTTEFLQSEGVKAIEFTLEGIGKISVVAFGKRRGFLLSEPDVVSDYLMNVIKDASTVTHFYKLDMAFREKLLLAWDTFSTTCCRILEESLPEETIRYFVLSQNTVTKGSYVERNAVKLAIQAKEDNELLIREILHGNGISRGLGSQRAFSADLGRWMDLDFGRQRGDIVARIDRDLIRRIEEQVPVGLIREDNDGDRAPIETSNRRQYSEESIREAFLRDWSND